MGNKDLADLWARSEKTYRWRKSQLTYGYIEVNAQDTDPSERRSNPTTERQWEALGATGQERLVNSFALRRLGSPGDIAYVVLFFASEQAGWITGQTLAVDGGRL